MELDPFFAVTDTIPTPTAGGVLSNTSAVKPESSSIHGSSGTSTVTNNNNNANICNDSESNNNINATTSATDRSYNVTTQEYNKYDNTPSEQQQQRQGKHSANTVPSSTTTNEQQIGTSEDDPEQIILNLLMNDAINENECNILRSLNQENNGLKEKISKLKNLLTRSAKAHKDSSGELSTVKSKLQTADYTIGMLQDKIEMLYKRPTHLDLLADFETNFDRAILSLGERDQGQSGGEDPSSSSSRVADSSMKQKQQTHMAQQSNNDSPNTEIGAAIEEEHLEEDDQEALISNLNSRMEQLESHNTSLLQRISKLEQINTTISEERDIAKSKISTFELDLRVSKLESSKAIQILKDKSIAITEMQFEIDLVTKSSLDAISKSNATLEAAKDIRVSKRHCEELQAKVDALQEWALASTEAKRLTVEHAHDLESKLKTLEMQHNQSVDQLESPSSAVLTNTPANTTSSERRLWSKSSSKVVGAGMIVTHCLSLGDDVVLADAEVNVLLRWKFDITPMDMDIEFAIYKGNRTDAFLDKGKAPEYLVEPRSVHGGAGGEVASAFAIQGACTLEWSNKRSWVRPRAIKFTVDAFAVME